MTSTSCCLDHVGRLYVDPGWHLPSHVHSNHEMIVVLGGECAVVMLEQEFKAGPGHVLLYPDGVYHEEWSLSYEPLETIFVAFSDRRLSAGTQLQVRDAEGRIRQLARWLYAERDSFHQRRDVIGHSFMASIIAEYLRLVSCAQNPLVERIREAVRQRIDQPIRLGQLAELAGMSKFHFVRQYKALTGRTPMEDVRHLRVRHARDLILSTNLPLKAIAPRAGLADPYQLSRLFRRYLDMTPGELRGNRRRSKNRDDRSRG